MTWKMSRVTRLNFGFVSSIGFVCIVKNRIVTFSNTFVFQLYTDRTLSIFKILTDCQVPRAIPFGQLRMFYMPSLFPTWALRCLKVKSHYELSLFQYIYLYQFADSLRLDNFYGTSKVPHMDHFVIRLSVTLCFCWCHHMRSAEN